MNVDGSMRKTPKSKLLENFNIISTVNDASQSISIIDMGDWQLHPQTTGKLCGGVEGDTHLCKKDSFTSRFSTFICSKDILRKQCD